MRIVIERANLIAVVGENGAGKDSWLNSLKFRIRDLYGVETYNFVSVGFSDILRSTCELWKMEKSRDNLQKWAQAAANTFGPSTLSDCVEKRILDPLRDPKNIVLIGGVRWLSDEATVERLSGILVYVTAAPEIRLQRIRTRNQYEGDADKTIEQFRKEEEAPNEVDIPKIGNRADWTFRNEGAKDLIETDVDRFARMALG